LNQIGAGAAACDKRSNTAGTRTRSSLAPESKVATIREVDDNVTVDLGADGRIIGIELLFVCDYLNRVVLTTRISTTSTFPTWNGIAGF
jgi:uncharacterized protein YuzE